MSLFHDVFTYFTRYCRVPICWFWAGKCLLGAHVTNLIYPRAEWRHRSTVFIFNFEHISHLVLVLLLLILSMYLIAGFDTSYFNRFQIKMNSSFIVYSFLERNYKEVEYKPPCFLVKTSIYYKLWCKLQCKLFFIFFIFW